MSTVDPFLAVAAAIAAADPGVADASLNLGIAAEVLQAQLNVGDLLAALVLAPQGGNDLISIFGQTVVAQLPAGVHPGETLLLLVTAFSGNQVLVRNLGVADPQNPPSTAQLILPPPAEGAPQAATLTTIPPEPANQANPANPGTADAQVPAQIPASAPPIAPLAPSPAVFVAASVQPASLEPPLDVARAAVPQHGTPVALAATPPELEARILAARATAPALLRFQRVALPTVQTRDATTAPSTPTAKSAPGPTPAASRPPLDPPIPPTSGAERLLARLRVPATPLTLSAAKMVADSATAVPRALARLEAVLARSATPVAGPLRSLVGFIARLDPGNERAFAEQIAAYVGNVLDGGESKLVALLQAHAQADAPAGTPASSTPTDAKIPTPQAAQTPTIVAAPIDPSGAQARAVERGASLDHDLKSLILAMTQAAPEGAPPALASALNDALVALTAAQLNVLSSNANDPNAMSLALPVFFREGGKPVLLRIARDAPQRNVRLDADNFHIGFVLDTQSLGTVAIDVETVGRSVKLDVKTERASSADRFRGALGDLSARLERLRYRVATARAGVLSARAPEATPPPVEPAPGTVPDRWDVRA
jgi:hypothetical protein